MKTEAVPSSELKARIIEKLYTHSRRETKRAVAFVKSADYARAKFCESRNEGLHKAISIVLDEAVVEVKDESKTN